MVAAIVHSAIARKMLCNPVNSLIADTEFSCAVGILLRILKAGQAGREGALEQETVSGLQNWLLQKYEAEISKEFDMPVQNLIVMIKEYHAENTPFDKRLKELFVLGLEEEIHYPKGRFL